MMYIVVPEEGLRRGVVGRIGRVMVVMVIVAVMVIVVVVVAVVVVVVIGVMMVLMLLAVVGHVMDGVRRIEASAVRRLAHACGAVSVAQVSGGSVDLDSIYLLVHSAVRV